MWLSRCKSILLEIENSSASTVENQIQTWPVRIKITIDGCMTLLSREIKLKPFDHETISRYLNNTLDRDVDEERAQAAGDKIDRYRKKLFESLDLREYLPQFTGCKVEINVCANETIHEPISIHSVHWEHLEDIDLWCRTTWKGRIGPVSVTVRRCVGNDLKVRRRISHAQNSGKVETFNILLVVARMHLNGSTKIDYLNPTSVLCALLESQEELRSRGSHQRLHIEVVRPGSFEELERHLRRRREGGGTGNFQVVHFDMHGDVSQTDGAYLKFNKYERSSQQLVTTEKGAEDIAKLLKKYDIDCVVLSACKSAKSDADDSANLSWSLLKHGMSSVLAMSYNMPDTMSKIFYRRFYHEIFVKRREFAYAATVSRHELVGDRKRWSYCIKDYRQMDDWFIPVVYSNGNPWYIERHPDLLSPTRISLQPFMPLIYWLFLGIALITCYIFIYTRFTSSITIVDSVLGYARAYFWLSVPIYLVTPYSYNMPAKIQRKLRKDQFYRSLDAIDQDRKNILRIEGDLRHSKRIILHTMDDVDMTAQQLLGTLTDIWRRTLLVEHRVIIQAEWFIQRFEWKTIMISLAHILYLHWRSSSPGLEPLDPDSKYGARTVVVINNVDLLFPEKTKLEDYHVQAQQRFDDWLSKHLRPETHVNADGTTSWYLILVGQGPREKAKSWADSTFGNRAPLRAMDYTNPRNFSHNPERPVMSRNWLQFG